MNDFWELIRVAKAIFPQEMEEIRGGNKPYGFYLRQLLNSKTGLQIEDGPRDACAAAWLPRLREMAQEAGVDLHLSKKELDMPYQQSPAFLAWLENRGPGGGRYHDDSWMGPRSICQRRCCLS